MNPEETRLLELFAALPPSGRASLLDYADFLHSRNQGPAARTDADEPGPVATPVPQLLPRPEQETVIAALRRLSISYPMLDKSRLLNDTSGLVTQHIMQGRTPAEVIDEMEAIFVSHYESWRDKS